MFKLPIPLHHQLVLPAHRQKLVLAASNLLWRASRERHKILFFLKIEDKYVTIFARSPTADIDRACHIFTAMYPFVTFLLTKCKDIMHYHFPFFSPRYFCPFLYLFPISSWSFNDLLYDFQCTPSTRACIPSCPIVIPFSLTLFSWCKPTSM